MSKHLSVVSATVGNSSPAVSGAGAQVGDLAVLVMLIGDVPPPSHEDPDVPQVDTWLPVASQGIYGAGPEFMVRYQFVPAALLDGDRVQQVVEFTHRDGFDFLYRGWLLLVLRGVKSVESGGGSGPNDYLPALPGAPGPVLAECDAGVTIMAGTNGTVAGHHIADLNGVWNLQDFRQSGRLSATAYTWVTPDLPDPAIPEPGMFPFSGSSRLQWFSASLALTLDPGVIPVVRQYPRDDSRGLGSATRIHPPPRARRIVGGYL